MDRRSLSPGRSRYIRRAGHPRWRADLRGRAVAVRAAMPQQAPAGLRSLLQERLSSLPVRSWLRFAGLFDGMRELGDARSSGVPVPEGMGADVRYRLVQGPAADGGADTRSHAVAGAM